MIVSAMETSAKRAQMIHDTLHDQSQAGHDERAIVAQIEKLKPRFGEKDVRELINDLEAQRESHVKLRESLERFKINMARLNASLGLMRTRLIEMSAAEEATLQRELAEQAREIRDRTERFTRVLLETSDEAGGDDLQRELDRDAAAKGRPGAIPLRNRATPPPEPARPTPPPGRSAAARDPDAQPRAARPTEPAGAVAAARGADAQPRPADPAEAAAGTGRRGPASDPADQPREAAALLGAMPIRRTRRGSTRARSARPSFALRFFGGLPFGFFFAAAFFGLGLRRRLGLRLRALAATALGGAGLDVVVGLGHEPQRRQRRQRDLGRVVLAVPADRLGLEAAHVADARAAVEVGVGVDRLAPAAAVREPDAVVRCAPPARSCPRTAPRAGRRACGARTRSRCRRRRWPPSTRSPSRRSPSPTAPARPCRRWLRSRTSDWMPPCSGFSSRCQSSERFSLHSASCANSWPMNSSFLPGCAHM